MAVTEISRQGHKIMIRRYRAHRRAYAVFFTAIFSFVGWADASGLHLCSQHNAPPVMGSHSDDTAADRGQTDLAGAANANAGASHGGDHEDPCICVGIFDDEGSALQVVRPDAVFLDPPTITCLAGARASSAVLTPSPYRLPFANAPPHLI